MSETLHRTVTIAKRRFDLNRDDVERRVQAALPEPLLSHYVVIGERRYPPKQVIGLLTGLDRADFTSHQARRVLKGLGFAVGRKTAPAGSERDLDRTVAGPPGEGATHLVGLAPEADVSPAERLRPFRGQWVATKDDELLVAAHAPGEVVSWLATHGQRADSMFRVPEDELALGGMAPL